MSSHCVRHTRGNRRRINPPTTQKKKKKKKISFLVKRREVGGITTEIERTVFGCCKGQSPKSLFFFFFFCILFVGANVAPDTFKNGRHVFFYTFLLFFFPFADGSERIAVGHTLDCSLSLSFSSLVRAFTCRRTKRSRLFFHR